MGIVVAINQAPPYHSVRNALVALSALREQNRILASKWPSHLWYRAPQPSGGLIGSEPSKSFGDFTVYTSANDCSASLVDMKGGEVHRWKAPFHEVWPDAHHVESWLPDQFVYMRRAVVFPNGDLLAVYESTVNSPYGCGLAKLDRNSKVLWTYDAHTHHDLDVDQDGLIYVLTNRLRRVAKDDTNILQLTTHPVIIEDTVTILSPEGEEQKTISLLDALTASPYFRPLASHVDHRGDLTHNNTVNLVGPRFAAHHNGVSEGDLMLCLRNLNLVVVLNLESETIVWATSGPWNHPHDPDPLNNGNILIFNNVLAHGREHGSSVLEFDPLKSRTAWSYFGDGNVRLRSDIRACQQALPNGNVLITESERGRIVEVNRSGQIVWEYVNPVRGGDDQELVPIVCGAHRYTREQLPFIDAITRAQPNSKFAVK